jgi:glycosyltransferase involved in cell wall biosynthesis
MTDGTHRVRSPRVWLAIHAWYHPDSETDGYRRSIATALAKVGIEFQLLRGRTLPYGTIGQSIFPFLLRSVMTYGPSEGIIHDLYGDSVFTDVDVATIQDLYWNVTRPSTFIDKIVKLRQLVFQGYRRTVRRSKSVIVTTTFTKGEILRAFGGEFEGKIHVIPIPCEPDAPRGSVRGVYDVLWVGSALSRKAPLDFVKAIDALPKRYRVAIRLRNTSPIISDDVNLIRNKVAKYRREGRLVDLLDSALPWEDLDALYRSSKCLVSTSNYEGFHMPVAEAYFRGVNVVLPNAPFYRCTYANEGGIHWYERGFGMANAIVEAVENGPFEIDRVLAERHSNERVGRSLAAVYESVVRR